MTRLPWPDSLAMHLAALVRARGEASCREAEQLRAAVTRHALLAYTLCIRGQQPFYFFHIILSSVVILEISSRLRRRYPSLSSLARCGLVSGGEVARLGPEAAWWRPLVWSAELLTEKEDLYRYGKGGRARLH